MGADVVETIAETRGDGVDGDRDGHDGIDVVGGSGSGRVEVGGKLMKGELKKARK